ncbi:hypothetical protein [Nonomuraea candida]|uniref:hypothetical protein n=1 Tax=Nonomuraea candida TaxID=359159 RepID=UPI0005BCAF49|nr:hypothetical protein [Nonomuraea candida]
MYTQGTKGLRRIKSWIQDLVASADYRICVEPDEFAYRMSWTVTKTGFGSRRYRDPRFDQLRLPSKVTEEVS